MTSYIDIFLILVALIVAGIMFHPMIHKSETWHATATPLASIIGSGFLVIAPVLGIIMGKNSLIAIVAIVIFAYLFGSIIRFNIRYLEPLLINSPENRLFNKTELLSEYVLFIAYIISVAFYIRLLSSFLLYGIPGHNEFAAQLLTTFIMCVIAVTGYFRGFNLLEWLEIYSVNIKLAIIAALLTGLLYFHFDQGKEFLTTSFTVNDHTLIEKLRLLAGMLLVVQGFETSRYLEDEYTCELRISTMKIAQIISGLIYISFIYLSASIFYQFSSEAINETAIISMSEIIAVSLPVMLIAAACMSQFSAAVADTVGAGGLLVENRQHKISPNVAYVIVLIFGIFLIWSVNIFEIITIASRAFGLYYLLQALSAISYLSLWKNSVKKFVYLAYFTGLLITLSLIVIFAIPAT